MLNETNFDFLKPIQSEEFLPPLGRWTVMGGLFISTAFVATVTLAAVIRYTPSVRVYGTIRPTGEIRLAQSAIEGIVSSIHVQEHQTIKRGQAIATVDNYQLQTKQKQLEASIQSSQAQLTQIATQVVALDRQMASAAHLMHRTVASAQATLSHNQRDYRDRQITTQADVQEALSAMEMAKIEMQRYQKLANTGAITDLQIQEKEQAFKIAQARLEKVKAALDPSNASVAIATEQIAQERARGEAALAALLQERDRVLSRQIDLKNQLDRDLQELQKIKSDLQKRTVVAPIDGTVLKLDLRNPGQMVQPGTEIAQIAPNRAPLIVKALVPSRDISKIQICQAEKATDCQEGRVQLRVAAYPYPEYGTLNGAIRSRSPDAIATQSNEIGTPSQYYEVTIQPEKLYLEKGDRQYPIQAGMEISADILSREETVLTFLLRKTRLLAGF
ncbi:HlyD family secretion protein [Pseudanabaena sp. PCC 6802]|uniref:HlyD family secretion protein n=1 Tax=Pseudanabaena sp. PCC 6802 TaxID=118173 RepID=UPI000349A647|nr:HlyD family efflux transporter periplasmic adaptor subunit [Pseudanabaena sp. PCC 6802]